MSATAQTSCGPATPRGLKPLARESDHRLVELSRAGDEQAFETLVRRHRHELGVYAGRLLGAEGRAEDVLQQALMSAWVALRDRDATVADPRAWLYGIVHNAAVTVLRRARHDTVELNEALDTPHAAPGPEVRAVVGEILAGLAEMPEIQRRALVMTAVSGSSHEEAAAALGVSGGAVRGMVYRARATLRRAAAALLPAPLWNWAARLGHRGSRLAVDPTDAATAVTSGSAASAGVAAMVIKGGAIVAAVGAVAAAGGALLPAAGGHRHHHPSAPSHLATPHRASLASAQASPAIAHGPVATPSEGRHGSDTAAHTESRCSSGGRGRGDGSSSSHVCGRGGKGSSRPSGSRGSSGSSGSSGSGGSSGSSTTSGRGGGDSGSASGGSSNDQTRADSSHGGPEHSSGGGPSAASGGSGESGRSAGGHQGSGSGG